MRTRLAGVTVRFRADGVELAVGTGTQRRASC